MAPVSYTHLDEVVYNLEDMEIDSNYTCTYYPWVKYFDQDNNQYIYLPVTKDVVRNFAQTDNQYQPWLDVYKRQILHEGERMIS